jgi:hypothetical protein
MQNNIVKSVAVRAHDLHKQLVAITAQTSLHFFQFGEILKEIRDAELWKTLGCDSFESYFSDPELDCSRSSVYHAISLVEHFPDWKTMSPVPTRKLIMIAPHLTDGNKTKLLEYASGLSSSDLQKQLTDMGLKEDTGFVGLPKVYRCQTCHKVKGVFHTDL